MSSPHSQLLARLRDKSATIGIVGLGYVGLPLLLRYSEAGFKVLGLDVDESKVDHLNDGKSYIAQFGSDRVAKARAAGMEATTDSARISEADAVIICVPTPLNKYREPDLRFVVDTMDPLTPAPPKRNCCRASKPTGLRSATTSSSSTHPSGKTPATRIMKPERSRKSSAATRRHASRPAKRSTQGRSTKSCRSARPAPRK